MRERCQVVQWLVKSRSTLYGSTNTVRLYRNIEKLSDFAFFSLPTMPQSGVFIGLVIQLHSASLSLTPQFERPVCVAGPHLFEREWQLMLLLPSLKALLPLGLSTGVSRVQR